MKTIKIISALLTVPNGTTADLHRITAVSIGNNLAYTSPVIPCGNINVNVPHTITSHTTSIIRYQPKRNRYLITTEYHTTQSDIVRRTYQYETFLHAAIYDLPTLHRTAYEAAQAV